MIYLICKKDSAVYGNFSTIGACNDYIARNEFDETEFVMAEDIGMKFISRVAFIESEGEKTCIYNDIDWWKSTAPNEVMNNFASYKIYDILGEQIDITRFKNEYFSNNIRMNVDGRPGQIEYNMQVGKEFISLFREECILTNFTNESNTSPMIIFEKLTPVIAMLDAGAFREAKQYLASYRQKLNDDFLTDERIDKYIAMLDAADAIEYATEEEYFYTV